jgi:hypothetical protein
MQPVPCNHCGYNFMRQTTDPEAIRLCNGCAEKEKQRKVEVKKEDNTVGILVKVPKDVYKRIEEYCTNEGMDFTKYFISLHEAFWQPEFIVHDQKVYQEPNGWIKHTIQLQPSAEVEVEKGIKNANAKNDQKVNASQENEKTIPTTRSKKK